MKYDHAALQQKYQQLWRDEGVYSPDMSSAERPYYNLMMFPYPSAEGLHVGNMYAFTGADVHGRFRRMQGFDVFEPIGLDGFGIHSENYAIKVGKHPREQAEISQENFYRQLSLIGNGFAWEQRLETYDPHYYRWTQWLFAEMFRQGLAYQAEANVNWCPSCKTVLADEQVEDGQCERCKSEVVRRQMTSWYLKITDYADRLLDNIDSYEWTDVHGQKHTGLDWPKKVTLAQKNWIGRSQGLDIDFQVEGHEDVTLTVWTKFWETVFGTTYLVLAPEHAAVQSITTPDQRSEVEAYVESARNKSDQERKASREKTGVFTGAQAINPVNGQAVPVYVADYVLPEVGTGAVMGVPAHDQRDLEFAQQFDLPVLQVVRFADAATNAAVAAGEIAVESDGELMNSGEFDGQSSTEEGKQAMKDWMVEQGFARMRTDYHLRDWLISRQRYWGPPIPLVFSQEAYDQGIGERDELPGWFSVPDDQLPVTLPHLDAFQPEGDGTSPLDNAAADWKEVTIDHPKFQGTGVRETNVSDTFLDSSWYFLRYPAVGNEAASDHPFPQLQPGKSVNWFPVDAYIGGAEHAVLHLLYARFITMVLHDWGMVPFEEPFPFLFGHGLIIKDGAKMSKSRGNVVNPDEYIKKYGADALRTYLMFLGPYEQGGDFRDTGMHAMYKWLARVWETVQSVRPNDTSTPDVERQLHIAIEANTREMAEFKFNTCIARLMETINVWRNDNALSSADAVRFLQLLAPFAPYLAEELYQHLQDDAAPFQSIHRLQWPQADASKLQAQSVVLAVQVQGKMRGTVELSPEEARDQATVLAAALALESVQKHLGGKEPRKVIFVPAKIINIIIDTA